MIMDATVRLNTGGSPFYRDHQNIPLRVKDSLDAYVLDGRALGSFLTAVLENDLKEAVSRADEENYLMLGAIVGYCREVLPANCWGSENAVADWQRGCGWRGRYGIVPWP